MQNLLLNIAFTTKMEEWRKLMESKKFNWNKILSGLIAGVGIALVCLFLGICFLVPVKVSIKALTKDDINEYNISFISAKTKIKSAENYEKVQKTGYNNTPYYTYQYHYNADLPEFYTKTNGSNSNTLGNISVSLGNENFSVLKKYSSSFSTYSENGAFIPTNAVSYKNTNTDSIEDIFYDEADENDFVLINNYNSYAKNYSSINGTQSFDVENFYLSFGTPYLDEEIHTTPIHELSVTGKLYANGKVHNLVLNEVPFTYLGEGNTIPSRYWYQYFDLNNLSAYQDSSSDKSNTYAIADQQGKYEITFKFIKYVKNADGNWEVGNSREEFVYTFYLLDANNYDVTPTLTNAELGEIGTNITSQYYYNFTSDYPTLTYDPSKFNLSYTRENRDIKTETISSSFSLGTYTLNGKKYPKGILTFTDSNGNNKKQVFILCYYNDDQTKLEYLYLSNNSKNDIETIINKNFPSTYSEIMQLVNNETLDFEYKTTQILSSLSTESNTTIYSTKKYYTYDYNLREFSLNNTMNYDETNCTSVEYIKDYVETKKYDRTTQSFTDDEGIIVNVHTYSYSTDNITYSSLAEMFEVDTNIVTNLKIDNTLNSTTHNAKILNKLNYLNKFDINIDNATFEYDLVLDDLGIYTFDYNYNTVIYNSNLTQKEIITNNSTTSTNVLGISDFAQNYIKSTPASTPAPNTKDLTLNVYGYLSSDNQVTLNGVTYTYKPKSNELSFNDGTAVVLNLGSSTQRSAKLGNATVNATYAVNTDSQGQFYLTITYKIAEVQTTVYQTSYTSKMNSKDYLTYFENKVDTQINFLYDNNQTSEKLSSTLIKGSSDSTFINKWQNIIDIFEYIEDNNQYSLQSYSTSSTYASQDILHIFGSMTYFNKTNPNATDTTANNDKYKFRQYDTRLDTNYTADITKYVKSSKGFYSTSGFNVNNDLKNISDNGKTGLTNVALYRGLDVNDIIVTDITPIFWKNLSSLLYSDKVSQSYIYRYSDYKIENGYINYGSTCATDLYTKDTYCSQDGLYEIVVLYKYDDYKSLDTSYNYNNTIFYQVFSFIIDNQSPKIDIKVQDTLDVDEDGDTTEYITKLSGKYTNQNVEISWNKPSFFQNDVYIDVERLSYDNESEFKATYKQGSISSLSGETYVNNTTSFANDNNKYYVYITSNNAYSSNGNYKVTLHYSSRGASTSTEEFIIDKEDITGMEVLPAMQNADGSFSINYNNQNYTAGKQIINYDFTYRYNQKSSNAKIYTYWYKIDLMSTNEYDQILNLDGGKTAITTTFKVNGSDIESFSSPNRYNYNYNTDETILSSNYFTSNSSCIYLFKMKDEAGNECRYVVFYDTTTPRFTLKSTATDDTITNHIINDTTILTWGDYKAIKIDTPSDFIFNTDNNLNNYNNLSNINNELEEALTYINSASTAIFNNTQIKNVNGNFYMLLPISAVTIQDVSSSTLNSANSTTSITFDSANMPDNFYFFPTDPITIDDEGNNKINIGSFQNEELGNLVNINSAPIYKTAINSDAQTFNRFITVDDYEGTIGKGEFTYQIYDGQRNKVEGYVWMTLDKTQTFAYGIFDTKTADDPSKATAITGEEGTYALSKLYISSLESSHSMAIPDYTLTYRFYELNDDMYEDLLNNYEIYSVAILDKNNNSADLTITEAQTYLQLTYKKIGKNEYQHYYIELTDEAGNVSAKHSYPYDIQGVPGEPDSAGNPQHIYDVNKSSYTQVEGEHTRLFSNIINPTTDTSGKTDTVTQEGLYIFKRMYENSSNLGLDSRIAYYIYYVDRTGIINVTTLNSISEQLYTSKQDFGFVLGSDYTNVSLKKYIDSNDLKNAQSDKDLSATYSSSYNNISNLFTTNKTLVQFNVTADKYNFVAFSNKFKDSIYSKISSMGLEPDDLTTLQNTIYSQLFNDEYYSNGLYKINLTISKGNVKIIDESETDSTKIYNTSAIESYLKGSYETSGKRNNSFNFYLQDSNSNAYNVYLKDNSGYKLWAKDGSLLNSNYNPNELDISFYIKQIAPTGDSYGKYYGRHNYDEDTNSSHSIPIKEYVDANGHTQTTYALLEEYLKSGQLEPLSLNYKSESYNSNGKYVQLYSTNNESLIFTFDITQDDTQAQIDPNNIKIYKGSTDSEENLIFNRVNGQNIATTLVSESRQLTSIFTNEIYGVTKYAIVVFDNNLDQILNSDEKAYSNFRLLDSIDNVDNEKYYIQISYVGDKDNYIQEDSYKNKIYYHSTTYEVTIDREKPEYNLTKLMSLDKYVYNTVDTEVTTSNYSQVFQSYKSFYNFQEDTTVQFERSDLENYFFALDYRKDSSFVFESISDLDSSGGIYIRKVSPINYKFSKTPDDYQSYYEATYLTGNPQFSSDRVTVLTKYSPTSTKIDDTSKYYYLAYGAMSNSAEDKTIKVYDIMRFLEVGQYYEIIERDEAKNYRVYAVYLPNYQNTQIRFEYKENSNSDTKIGTLTYNSNPTVPSISGIEFNLTKYTTSDYFIKAILTISSKTLSESLNIYYSPKDTTIYVTTSNNLLREKFENVSTLEYKEEFINVINNLVSSYNDMVSANNEHGYTINLVLVDRLGIKSSISDTKLFNYELTYNVAGSILKPIFAKNTSNSNMFTMTIPAMDGTTYVEQVSAYIFQGGWTPKDPDDLGNSFSKSASEFKNGTNKDGSGTTYNLSKGVYKFVITDNFKRKNTYFYEYGTSNQSGGILNFNDKSVLYTDGYTYTAKSANFVYDNSIYDIYIKFVGEVGEYTYEDSDVNPHIVYSSTSSVNENELKQYGIKIAKIDNITTISFTGVSDLTKYHIKTIPASISSQYNYTWGAEEYSDEYLVYDNKLAIYTAVESPIIRNTNGNVLDTSEHLHLSEDFEVTTSWTNGYSPEKQISFDSKIYLVRTYTENNVVRTEIYSNSDTYSITKQGDYTAYVINALNNKSNAISFTRGESEIGIYTVLNVDNSTSKKLSPSAKVTSENYETEEENRTLIEFNYFTTIDYFSFKDITTNSILEPSVLVGKDEEDTFSIENIQINRNNTKYMDIQVKSDLSIFVQLYELKKDGDTPYAKFRIYSKNKENKDYTYRFVKVYFLDSTDYNLANILVSSSTSSNLDSNAKNNNIYDSCATIQRPDSTLYVAFRFKDATNSLKYVDGNTIYVDRYFNGDLVETLSFTNINEQTEAKFALTQVGLYKFVIRDLAGRMQVFGKDNTASSSLQIYLINQILFEVNNSSPIDNQIFNDDVTIKIKSELAGVTLYNINTIGITVTRNGEEVGISDASEFTFTESGSYIVKMDATTSLADQQISATYRFIIVKTDIANNSFNVSKATGFEIDKIFKIVNKERTEMTETFKNGETGENVNSGSLIWITANNQGNSIFEIHLKYFNQTIKDYQYFSFNVWLNNDKPVIISSIDNGSSTKDSITLSYNPGIIYNQVGKCKILINDKEYIVISDDADRAVQTITITQKGTYNVKIVSEDGTLISSYKYTKNDPISKTTTIILVCIGIGAVVLVVLFLLIRRKGKYR